MTFMPPYSKLTKDEALWTARCLNQLADKQAKSIKRSNFYNTKQLLEKVGFSIPPQMAGLEAVLGWPAKAVDGLTGRLHLRGFVQPKKAGLVEDLDAVWTENRMAVEWPMLQTSACIHGCGFVATTPGDEDAGEPKTLVQTMSATECTGIWDVRKRRLTCALWCPDPGGMTWNQTAILFTEENSVTMEREGAGGEWQVRRVPNPLPWCPVTLVALQPQLGRPFGKSRISKSVQYLTQMAARTLLRTEVGAEFYNAPQRYAMGANMDDFVDDAGNPVSPWETILGNIWLMGRDEETDQLPQVGQFPQATMQPNVDMMRMITTLFAGETSLPVGSLGIIHDNPASAAAIDAAWADMTSLAELVQVDFGVQATQIAQNMLMIERDLDELPKELKGLRPKWRSASVSSSAALSDAVTKEITAGVLLPHSRIALEKLGYDEAEIIEIQAEHEAEEKKKTERDREVMASVPRGLTDEAGDPDAEAGEPPAVGGAGAAVEPRVAGNGPVPPRRDVRPVVR